MRTLRTLGTLALLVVGLAGCNQYDKLIEADSVCDQKWADLQAQLERRGDLVPNLVATVKASAQHEEKTLTEVAKARASASQIQLSGEDLQDPEKVAAFQKAQEGLHGALSRLLVTNEQYPQLQANAQFHDLQVQLEGTENRILRAREEYNAAARTYNAEIGKIRGAVVKRATGSTFKPRVYFTASAEATAVPKVTF
jgi:LemA protein